MSFEIIDTFEKEIAEYFNAPYAVATDCCTHAIELCLRKDNVIKTCCPNHTYLSIPMTFMKLNIHWTFKEDKWNNFYYLQNTRIIDAAVFWQYGGYIKNTLMCLSFQYKKHLNLGRGGIILCSKYDEYIELKKMSYDGRVPYIPWAEQQISTIGYHYYMTPETAKNGLDKLQNAKKTNPKLWSYLDYPDLTKMPLFAHK